MTSQVKITAHCSDDKMVAVVRINTATNEETITELQNGDSMEFSIYDDWGVVTQEVLKAKVL